MYNYDIDETRVRIVKILLGGSVGFAKLDGRELATGGGEGAGNENCPHRTNTQQTPIFHQFHLRARGGQAKLIHKNTSRNI